MFNSNATDLVSVKYIRCNPRNAAYRQRIQEHKNYNSPLLNPKRRN